MPVRAVGWSEGAKHRKKKIPAAHSGYGPGLGGHRRWEETATTPRTLSEELGDTGRLSLIEIDYLLFAIRITFSLI